MDDAAPSPARKDARSLRRVLARITLLVAGLVLGVSAALVLMTTRLHRTTETLGAAVESIRLVEEAEIDLLLHARGDDAIVRHGLETDLRRRLAEARRYATSDDEARILDDAGVRLEAYVAATRAAPAASATADLERAYAALESLANLNVRQARDDQALAADWNRAANAVGIGAAILITSLAGWLLWWLRDRAVRPILDLAEVMEAYARGDRTARAAEVGPAELRTIEHRFNRMADALDARRSAETAFLAGVAHDIRNPLTALDLSASLIGPNDPLPPEPRVRRTLALVRRQVKRLDRMVADFLDMTRIEAGQLQLCLERCDARELVRDVVELLESTAAGRRLAVSLPPGAVPIHCDPVRMEQVIGNLVGNALKYSPADSEVTVSVAAEPDHAVVRVRDRGVGIAADELARLFQPFQRVASSRDDVPGSGIGLFVVRRIVEAHGGRIDVGSVPGVGSEFVVRLPVESAHGGVETRVADGANGQRAG